MRFDGSPLRVGVIGPGAIGTSVAAALHAVGRTPMLFGRTRRASLTLHQGGDVVVVPGPVLCEPMQNRQRVDLVLLAVKTTQIEGAAPWLASLCHPDTVVCALQNGVEQEAMLASHVPGPIVPAVVWFPAAVEPDASVRLHGTMRLTLPDTAPALVVRDAFDGTMCAVDVAADFASVAWRKLLQNAVAGLMVLAGRRSGMYRRSDVASISRAYLRECLAVARADGAVLSDDVPDEIIEYFQSRPADLGTSILADREAKRALEWDIRNGIIVRRGREHGIETPISEVVAALLASASDGPG